MTPRLSPEQTDIRAALPSIVPKLSEGGFRVRILQQRDARRMPKIPPLADTKILRPAQTAIALELVREIDLLRLKTIARWHARGLPPDVTWEDLLQEAITRVLVGSRRVPDGVTTVAFIAGIMRSLRTEHWRRVLRESASDAMLRIDHES